MKTITIRQFQREFYTHIKDLPLTVTKNGMPIFDVISHDDNITTISGGVGMVLPIIQKKPNANTAMGVPVNKETAKKLNKIIEESKSKLFGKPRQSGKHNDLAVCSVCDVFWYKHRNVEDHKFKLKRGDVG